MFECDNCGTCFDEFADGAEGVCPECGFFTDPNEEPWDGFNSDAEADADVLASAGYGTDEDYGDFGGDYL